MPAAEISVDRDPVGAGQEFAVAIRTSPIASAPPARTSASYAIVLDASQSMSWPAEQNGETSRWTLALQAIEELLRQLPDRDEITAVAFDDRARVLVDTTTVAELRASGRLGREPAPEYGITDIGAGLTRAYELLDRSRAASRRAILFSDGEPNHGAVRPEELAAMAAEAAGRDIYTDAVGMGKDAKIEMLQGISALGGIGHVAAKDGSQAVITEVVGRLARQGQNLTASGGELAVEVHPLFPIEAVYQLTPARRRLGTRVEKGADGSQQVRVPLGAVGTGDRQPLFVVRLTAPAKIVKRHLPIMKVTGTLRSPAGTVALDEAHCAISGIAERPVVNLEQLMPQVRAADMETEIAARVKAADPSDRVEIYEEALARAVDAGLDDLVADYEGSLRGLREGLHPDDVHNEQRARSSTSRTSPNELLRKRPQLDPEMVAPRTASRRVVRRDESEGRRPERVVETEDWA